MITQRQIRLARHRALRLLDFDLPDIASRLVTAAVSRNATRIHFTAAPAHRPGATAITIEDNGTTVPRTFQPAALERTRAPLLRGPHYGFEILATHGATAAWHPDEEAFHLVEAALTPAHLVGDMPIQPHKISWDDPRYYTTVQFELDITPETAVDAVRHACTDTPVPITVEITLDRNVRRCDRMDCPPQQHDAITRTRIPFGPATLHILQTTAYLPWDLLYAGRTYDAALPVIETRDGNQWVTWINVDPHATTDDPGADILTRLDVEAPGYTHLVEDDALKELRARCRTLLLAYLARHKPTPALGHAVCHELSAHDEPAPASPPNIALWHPGNAPMPWEHADPDRHWVVACDLPPRTAYVLHRAIERSHQENVRLVEHDPSCYGFAWYHALPRITRVESYATCDSVAVPITGTCGADHPVDTARRVERLELRITLEHHAGTEIGTETRVLPTDVLLPEQSWSTPHTHRAIVPDTAPIKPDDLAALWTAVFRNTWSPGEPAANAKHHQAYWKRLADETARLARPKRPTRREQRIATLLETQGGELLPRYGRMEIHVDDRQCDVHIQHHHR